MVVEDVEDDVVRRVKEVTNVNGGPTVQQHHMFDTLRAFKFIILESMFTSRLSLKAASMSFFPATGTSVYRT